MIEDYHRARKAGQKQVQRDVAAGRYPYPPALDDILKGSGCAGEIPMGTAEIDMALIAGTKTRGRQNMFSSGFMPLAEEGSEFSGKWSDLIDSQRAEGLRDPIVVYEFLQRFYVQEGNKRVSVMRYLGMPTIPARITRVVPMPSDDKPLRIYQEFTRFYQVAPIYGITFSEEGSYLKLAALCGRNLEEPWPDDAVRNLRAAFDAFAASFRARGGADMGLEIGDAFLLYLKIYEPERVFQATSAEADKMVGCIWSEFVVAARGEESIAYVEAPPAGKAKLLPELKTLYKTALKAEPFRVAFIYEKNPLASGWTALHDQGRRELERRLGAMVQTVAYPDCTTDDEFDWAVGEAMAFGADLVVTVSSTQMQQALRAAVRHPDCAFINCSVSLSHSAVRTFSVRLYEPKFLLGMVAASMAENHRIGYVAGAPVFGSVAEINAFALGAAMVDPYATVHLKWHSARDYDWRRELHDAGVRIVSACDYPDPAHPEDPWGLYRVEDDGTATHLAEPVWKWGRYYELIVRSIRNDAWREEGDKRRDQALNYWWGMAAGILDVSISDRVARGPRRLVDALRQSVLSGRIHPFSGKLVSQEGTVRPEGAGRLSSDEIVRMLWLNENVVGRIPKQRELSADSLEKMDVSGLIPVAPEVSAALTEAKSTGTAALLAAEEVAKRLPEEPAPHVDVIEDDGGEEGAPEGAAAGGGGVLDGAAASNAEGGTSHAEDVCPDLSPSDAAEDAAPARGGAA